jgi:heme exporter protein A
MTLEAHALECIRGRRRLFSDLTFFIRPGDCFEVRGANGSGKTSLLRMLCGLLPPTSGEVLWAGERIETQRASYVESLTYVGHRNAVKDEMTTLENLLVSSALSGFELSGSEAQEALAHMSLVDHANTRARYLSEGQRRRLALARLVNCERPLWLLDEVMTSLDAGAVRRVAGLIDGHIERGGMAVIATHQDLMLSSRLTRRIELAA